MALQKEKQIPTEGDWIMSSKGFAVPVYSSNLFLIDIFFLKKCYF